MRRRFQACAGLTLLLAGLVACGRAPAPASVIPPVTAILVQPVDGGSSGEWPIRLQARYSTDLAFRVGGKIVERRAKVGDRVSKGQVLARLDPADAQQQVLGAQAALQAARHRLDFTRQQLQRDVALMRQELIARSQLEQSEDNQAAAAAAEREAAAQLTQSNNALGYNRLVAEHDGLITADNADNGKVVAAGQAVYTLAWTPDIDAVLDVSARDRARWQPGQLAMLRLPEWPGVKWPAQVREVAGHEDSLSGSYRVKLTVLHPDARVRPGMSAWLAAAEKEGGGRVRVPVSALFHQGDKSAVWVIGPDTGRLELRAVDVGEYRMNEVLITHGLKVGERIVMAGVHNVYRGERVRPVDPPSVALDGGDAQGQS